MVLPASPLRARCATCQAPYVHGKPFAHAAGCAQGGRGVAVAAEPAPKRADAGRAAARGKHRCLLGHPHAGKGEASACGPVHAAATHAGLTTFRPGHPGIPCFRLPADDSGRPAYASVDWVLCDAAGKPVLGLDWKGPVSHRAMFNHGDGFARTKRIFEAATGAKCVELKELADIAAALAALEHGRAA